MLARRLRLISAPPAWLALPERYGGSMKVAFATQDLKRVDAHFGWARNIAIYEVGQDGHRFVEAVQFDGDLKEDGNEDKLAAKLAAIKDYEDIKADLMEAIYHVTNPLIAKEQQAEVVEFMQSRGHDMVWNAIRYDHSRSFAAAALHFPT
jgi:hypothetical protein